MPKYLNIPLIVFIMNLLRAFNRLLAMVLMALVMVYKKVISPWLPNSCRFTPTCSAYTFEALKKYGALKGMWLGLKRIGRCHPWGGHGHDPVP